MVSLTNCGSCGLSPKSNWSNSPRLESIPSSNGSSDSPFGLLFVDGQLRDGFKLLVKVSNLLLSEHSMQSPLSVVGGVRDWSATEVVSIIADNFSKVFSGWRLDEDR